MLELIQVSTSMASPYKSLWVWVKYFFGYLVYEVFLWPESWRGSLYMYLLSSPRFWTLSIERFSFLFWSILNSVTLKTSNMLTLGSNGIVDLITKSYTMRVYNQVNGLRGTPIRFFNPFNPKISCNPVIWMVILGIQPRAHTRPHFPSKSRIPRFN